MKNILSILFVALVLFVLVPSVYAKGSPDKIVITGGGLARPVEITDRETLKRFDPWMGQFIDWSKGPTAGPVAGPSGEDQSYDVFFYIKWPARHSNYDRGDLKIIYSVRYSPGRNGGPGFVYLPGEGDDRYSVNSSTILRDNDDGKWHQASAAWDAVMKRVTTRTGTEERSLATTPVGLPAWGPRLVGLLPGHAASLLGRGTEGRRIKGLN